MTSVWSFATFVELATNHTMKFTGEEYYLSSVDRMHEARKIHDSGTSYALAMYLGGLAVECMLRAFRWRKNPSFEGRHDLEDLLKASELLTINDEHSHQNDSREDEKTQFVQSRFEHRSAKLSPSGITICGLLLIQA